MFKGFSQKQNFNGFPSRIFGSNQGVIRYGVSDCVFHLKAEDLGAILSNLSPVVSWKDSISNFEFIQSTAANQPRFITASPSYNGLPVVNFQDANRRMLSQISAAFNLATYVIVGNYEALSGTDSCTIGHNTINRQIGFGGGSGGLNGVYLLDSTNPLFSGTSENLFPKIAAITNSSITVNSIVENTRSGAPFNFIFNQIGAVLTSSNSFIGNLAEFLVFEKQLSSDEISTLMTALNSKYSLY